MLIEGLGNVVVGARFHPLDEIFFLALGGEQQDVGIGLPGAHADPAADFQARHTGHHPVQDRKRWSVVLLQECQRLLTIASHGYFIAPLAEGGFQQMPRYQAVICD